MDQKQEELDNLPRVVIDYIDLVIKKMRYRRKVRQEVKAELAGHFADALKDCRTDEERQAKAEQLIDEFGDAKLLAILVRRGKKRCRPLWRTMVARSFQAVGVLFILLVCYCVYISFAQPRIRINYVDEMNRLARPGADEDLNAAPLYQKAIESYVEPPKTGKKTQGGGVEPAEGGGKEADLLDAIRDKKWITDLTDEEVALLEQWVSDNGESLELFRQGSERPHCWWEHKAKDTVLLMFESDIPLGGIKNLGRLICWRAKLKANQGQIEWAFDDLVACYRTGRHLVGPRTLIEQLVGIAMRAIAVGNVRIILNRCEVQEDVLRDFHERVAELAQNDIFTVDFQTERFFYRDIIQRCFTDNGRGSGRMIPGTLRELEDVFYIDFGDEVFERVAGYGTCLGIALVSADREAMLSKFEDTISKHKTWAKMTPWELKKTDIDEWERREFDEVSPLQKSRYLLYHVMLPALRKVVEKAHQARTGVESLITTVAILRCKNKKGQYPESLDELADTGLLRKLPMDPYSDNPLIYRREDGDFRLYSVGQNFKDDDGVYIDNDDGRMSTWPEQGDTIFWPVK